MIGLNIKTTARNQMLDITGEIKKSIPSGFAGLALVYVPHTTAGITINEGADPSVKSDILDRLQELVPHHARYKHLEGNADSHIKTSLIGNSVSLIVDNSDLVLGTWQAVFLCEFDGPRQRKVYIEFIEQ